MKKILIFITFFYVSVAFACSPMNKNEGLFENESVAMVDPENAMVVFTGLIVREKRTGVDYFNSDPQFIVPERKWTIVQEEKIRTSLLCGTAQMTGERYLFVSKTRDVYEDRFLIELKNAGEYISRLARKNDFVGDMNPAWQFCREHKDCISIKNRCKSEVTINVEYKETYSRFLRSSKAYDCTKNISKAKPIFKCIDYFCS